MKKIGFIDYFLDEWHANKYPQWIEEASNGEMKVTYAYGKIDAESGLSNAAWCERNGIEQLGSIAEVVAKSDYLIVLSPDHPAYHEELAALPLRSGKPTYVDKTFAPDRAAALRLFALADQYGTPLYSSSALRYAEEYKAVDRNGITAISSIGPGLYANYSIHQIEPIVALLGGSAEQVMYIGTSHSDALLIAFSGGRQAEIRHLPNSSFRLAISYASEQFVNVRVETDFFAPFIADMLTFFRTGEATVDPDETIAIMTIIEYGTLAKQTPFQWIQLPKRV